VKGIFIPVSFLKDWREFVFLIPSNQFLERKEAKERIGGHSGGFPLAPFQR